jgi:hypothetical protein
MGAVKEFLVAGGCPGCHRICEKVYGEWWPHEPGKLAQCSGLAGWLD